jgi:hypothetical protein
MVNGETTMTRPKCSCDSFERLEGASVPAYIKAFLDRIGPPAAQEGEEHYCCRVCGREWERRAPEIKDQGKRPALVRVS